MKEAIEGNNIRRETTRSKDMSVVEGINVEEVDVGIEMIAEEMLVEEINGTIKAQQKKEIGKKLERLHQVNLKNKLASLMR